MAQAGDPRWIETLPLATEIEVLALNHACYAEEVAAGLHGKKAGVKAKAAKGKGAASAEEEGAGQLGLFA